MVKVCVYTTIIPKCEFSPKCCDATKSQYILHKLSNIYFNAVVLQFLLTATKGPFYNTAVILSIKVLGLVGNISNDLQRLLTSIQLNTFGINGILTTTQIFSPDISA